VNKNPKLENLKPFKKGQSGNPKGRPKLPDIKHLMVKYVGDEKQDEEWGAVIYKLLERAKVGDTRAIELLFKYGFGTPNPMPSDTEESKKEIGLNITLTMPDEATRKAD
jgi:hypothetical protein